MIREIGSEFHSVPTEHGNGLNLPKEGTLVFSGRTAMEAVLKNIPDAKTALLPSYCCDSMIEPFRRAGINVTFYDVNYRDGLEITLKGEADVLLWCNYFGFHAEMPEFEGAVIEDITHSFYSERQYHHQSDFLVASLRKWEPICSGGYCSVIAHGAAPDEEFINQKRQAMALKAQYLVDLDETKKPRFLSMFGQANKWLSQNYAGRVIDGDSQQYLCHMDMEKHKKIRRTNAHVLYEGLRGKVQFLFSEENMDCPLFVPIILPHGRNEVRQKLTDNRIYCPVHWPHPNAECRSNLYDMELSLICDQRYTEKDMERVVSVLCG